MSTTDGATGQSQTPPTRQDGVTQYGGRPPTADWRKYARASLWTVVVLVVGLLLAGNRQDATINLLFAEVTVPLFVALGVALGLGVLVGLSLGWLSRRRYDRKAIVAAKAKKK
jgi:uncharacterized integral membrane protein